MCKIKHMLLNKKSIIVGFLLVSVIILLVIRQNKNETESEIYAPRSYTQKQMTSFQVMESTNFNAMPIQFKLHVQLHDDSSLVPQKLFLINKESNKRQLELTLMPSLSTNECMSHEDMGAN